jgi:hypothetical protein
MTVTPGYTQDQGTVPPIETGAVGESLELSVDVLDASGGRRAFVESPVAECCLALKVCDPVFGSDDPSVERLGPTSVWTESPADPSIPQPTELVDRWLAPPSATRSEHAQDVTGPQPDGALVGQALGSGLVTIWQQPVLPWGTGFAAP